jgi:Flp pilus assembly protein TadD
MKFRDLARAKIEHGDSAGAIELLKRVLGEAPEDAEAHALLALALVGQKRLSAAEHEARLALGAAPDLPGSHYALGAVRFAQRRFAEAEKEFHAAIELSPDEPAHRRVLAVLCAQQGRSAEERQLLDEALALEPDSPATLAALADHHLRHNQVALAEQRAREALQAEPEHGDALVAMGEVLLRRGEIEEARQHALWAVRHDGARESAIGLLTAIKARQNMFLGMWWRWNTWMNGLGQTGAMAVLLGMFVVYRVTALALGQFGMGGASNAVKLVWLGIVAYSWVGPGLFRKMIDKELMQVRFRPEF